MAADTSIIASSKIFAFPASKRSGNYQQKARLLREETMTKFADTLLDTDGFVITDNYSLSDGKKALWTGSVDFEFYVKGYYFNLPHTSSGVCGAYNITGTTTNLNDFGKSICDMTTKTILHDTIYANIAFQGSGDFIELVGQDIDNNFTGVVFTYEPATVERMSQITGITNISSVYSLPVLTCWVSKQNNFVLQALESSKVKFHRKSLYLDVIDGGVLD